MCEIKELISKNNRFEELRKAHKLRQKDIADYLGVKERTYQNWKRGEKQISVEACAKLAKLYKVSIEYLLGLEEHEHPNNEYISDHLGLTEDSINTLWDATKGVKIEVSHENGLIAKINSFPSIGEKELEMRNALIVGNDGLHLLEALYNYVYFNNPVLITVMGENPLGREEGLEVMANKRHALYVMDADEKEIQIKTEHLNEINRQLVMSKLEQFKEGTMKREEALKDGKH